MEEKSKNKLYILIISILAILTLVTGYYAFKLKEVYTISTSNTYNEAFNDFVNYMNNVENYLAKAMISKSSKHGAETLTEIWRDSNLALVYLSRIPLNSEGATQTAKFLNQVSDYSFSLSRKTINDEELSEEDLKNLKQLYQHSIEIQNTLNQLSEELFTGEVSWEDLQSKNTYQFAQTVDNFSVFSSIDENLNQYEGLIYDGAYSDHINKSDKKGLIGEDISEEDAKEKIKNLFKNKKIESIESNGYLENADIPSYEFVVKFHNDNNKLWISISKKGGHLIQFEKNRDVEKQKLDFEDANLLGKIYLANIGFKNMKETYYIKFDNILTVNYAYQQNGIIMYPDLIKVKIALDDGEILGVETSGYLNSHTERKLDENIISFEEAKEKLNKELNIVYEGLSVIPTEWKTEIYCYEFKGKIEEKEFLIYINAKTGEEENVLVILDTPNGVLTM